MKEGDVLFEAGIGQIHGKAGWFWRARGFYMAEFCRTYAPNWSHTESDIEKNGGWLAVGPYKTRRGAERDLQAFDEAFQEFLQSKFPGLDIEDAPDPRTLN